MSTPSDIIPTKNLHPAPPGYIEPGPTQIAVVGGADSVPVEIGFEPVQGTAQFGIDIVFLIDNSGSMINPPIPSDPNGMRFKAIIDMIDLYAPTRNNLDRVAVFLFQGNEATQLQSWRSWRDTRSTIETLRIVPAGSGTPMAHGMRLVNDLLIRESTTSLFKLVVLLSDGEPTPDAYTSTPVYTCERLAEEAFDREILYCTIYLTMIRPPDDSALLERIALTTDYLTPGSPSERAKYYYRITDPTEILQAYQDFFREIFNHNWPHDVFVQEQLNPELMIDGGEEVVFGGEEFQSDQQITGTDLSEAINTFMNTGRFEVRINELRVKVALKFSVKLNMASIDHNDPRFDEDQICVNVDSPPSSLSYLQSAGVQSAVRVSQELPQAVICFRKGLSVTKSYDQMRDPSLVEIKARNLDLHPITAVQILEYPSGWVNLGRIEDDFEFKPTRMLFESRILPWLAQQISRIHGFPVIDMRRLNQELHRTYDPLIGGIEGELDPYLCQFWFTDNFPHVHEAYQAIEANFWGTKDQRGIYKLIPNLPPLSERTMRFRIDDASFLLGNPPNPVLTLPVDALEPSKEELRPRSVYTSSSDNGEWKEIFPNPNHAQSAGTDVKPDLSVRTCLSYEDVQEFHKLFIGASIQDPWGIMDSADIEALWTRPTRVTIGTVKMGVRVTVRNYGRADEGCGIRVKSIYVPITGTELTRDPANPRRFEIHPSRAFFALGSGSITVVRADPRAPRTCTIDYRAEDFHYLDQPAEVVPNDYLLKVRKAVIINVVNIAPAVGEEMLGNNKAIEVVQGSPSR